VEEYFSQLLNVQSGLSRLEVEIAIAKLKNFKSPGSDQIPTKLIQAVGGKLLSEIHKLVNFFEEERLS
jgi:hypothetical protein